MSVIVLPPQGDFVESSIPYPAGNWEGDFKSFPAACPALRLAEGSPVSAPVRRFVPALRAGWYPRTFKRLERGVGAFLSDCRGSSFYLRIGRQSRPRTQGGWDSSPSLHAIFCPLVSGFSEAFAFGKMPRAKGNADVRFYSRIKGGGRKRPPPKSQRPATRVVSRASGL